MSQVGTSDKEENSNYLEIPQMDEAKNSMDAMIDLTDTNEENEKIQNTDTYTHMSPSRQRADGVFRSRQQDLKKEEDEYARKRMCIQGAASPKERHPLGTRKLYHHSTEHQSHDHMHPWNIPSAPSSESNRHFVYQPHQPYYQDAFQGPAPAAHRHHRPYHSHHAPILPPNPRSVGYELYSGAPYHSASFESQILSPNPASTVGTAYPYYPPQPPTSGGAYPPIQWAPITPVEYIVNIKPDDVLSGRGGATNSHSGNRVFRSLVKQYQDQYLRAKKRDKPGVASIVVDKIRQKGGRFLRRIDTVRHGQVLWFDIGDDRAREKTCQALREGAPELRRKKRGAASVDEEEDTKRSDSNDDSERNLCSTFSAEQTGSPDDASDGKTMKAKQAPAVHATGDPANTSFARSYLLPKDGPIMIRPSALLLQKRDFRPIAVDELDPSDREIYLRDFLPPDPTLRRKTSKQHILTVSRHDCNLGPEHDHAWPVVQV